MSNPHTYQQDLLRKYIDGTITADERHELEKMALDDDMLFATLEGYAQASDRDHKSIINNLHEALPPTRSKRRIIPWAWMSAAAGFVLIAAIGFLIRQDQASNSSPIDKSISMESGVMEEAVMEEAVIEEAEIEAGEILADATIPQSPQNQEEYKFEEEALDKEIDLQTTTTNATKRTQNKNEAYANDVAPTIAQPKKSKRDYIEKMEAAPAIDDQELVTMPSAETLSPEEIRSLPTKSISDIAATSAGLSTSDGDDDVSIRGSRENSTNYYVDGIRVAQSNIPDPEMNMESEDVIAKDQEQSSAPSQQKNNKKSREKSKAKSMEGTMDMADSAAEMILLKGTVIDESKQGIIAANVSIENADIGTVTDFDGNFELTVPKSEVVLIVSYIGYEDINYPFRPNGEPLTIQMKESSALLDEVSISAYGTQQIKNAEPLMGYPDFEAYLDESFIRHKDCARSSVTLSFTITADGDVTDITTPIKDECFYEAKRLLLNAGKWKTVPARKRMVVEYEVLID